MGSNSVIVGMLASFGVIPGAAAQVSTRVIAYDGERLRPGDSDLWSFVYEATSADDGTVVVTGLVGGDAGARTVIRPGRRGELLMRDDAPIEGFPGVEATLIRPGEPDFSAVAVGGADNVAVTGFIRGTSGVLLSSILRFDEHRAQIVAIQGQPAPGLPGSLVTSFLPSTTSADASGSVGYTAALNGQGCGSAAMYVWRDGIAQPVLAEGFAVASSFGSIGFCGGSAFYRLTQSGDGAFAGWLDESDGGQPVFSTGSVLVIDGQASVLVRDGGPAPGIPGALVRQVNRPFDMNATREFINRVRLEEGPGGVDASNDWVAYLHRGGSFEIVAREGDAFGPVPGSALAGQPSPRLSNSGMVAVNAALVTGLGGVGPSDDQVVYTVDGGVERLLFREGDTAPDSGGLSIGPILDMQINTHGDVAIIVELAAASRLPSEGDPDLAIIAYDAVRDEKVLVAKTGDPVRVATEAGLLDFPILDFRVDSFSSDDGDWFNDAREIVYTVNTRAPGSAIRAALVSSLGAMTGPCTPADSVEPFGVVDLDDLDAFIGAFAQADAAADFVPPFDLVDLDDLDAFIAVFLAGCP